VPKALRVIRATSGQPVLPARQDHRASKGSREIPEMWDQPVLQDPRVLREILEIQALREPQAPQAQQGLQGRRAFRAFQVTMGLTVQMERLAHRV